MTLALETHGLRKAYGDAVALEGIDLSVPEGSVFALLGPNGAGKTTTVQILSTLIRADAGAVRVAGHDPSREPEAVRAAIGVTGQFSAVDNLLTGEENLRLMADLNHLARAEARTRIADLLERFDLVEESRKPAAVYSGGLRRRLDLAMTLMGDPRIIFLDEPTTGLDPRSRRSVWRIVRELVDRGVTIFLTTHYLEEADELADRVALLDHGRVVAEGTPEDLKRRIPGGFIRLRFADARTLDAAARVVPEGERDDDGLALQIPSDGGVRSLRALLDRLDGASSTVELLTIHTPDLDDVFLALTGRADTDGGWASMSARRDAVRDAGTMLRRTLKHMARYPSVSLLVVGLPVVLLLLFVYVFGGTLGAGLGAASGGRAIYVNYVTPGIVLVAVAGVAQGTAIAVSMDMADGIIARFRTMGISRGAVLTGHVLGSTIQTILGLTVVIGVAIAIGFRPNASPAEWIAAFGLLTAVTLAITWLSVALGLRAKSVEAASNLVMPLLLLVFVGSGFVPTDSMPTGLRGFAEYEPFTPVIETLRGLLLGTPIGHDTALAIGWCVLIGLAGYRWAMRQYDRDPSRTVRLLSAGHSQ